MSYIVARTREGGSGTLTYYYLVESYREDGKVKQKTLAYLGKYPYQTKFDLDSELAVKVAQVFSDMDRPLTKIKKELEELGIAVPPGELKEVRLIFNPPLNKMSVHIYCTGANP